MRHANSALAFLVLVTLVSGGVLTYRYHTSGRGQWRGGDGHAKLHSTIASPGGVVSDPPSLKASTGELDPASAMPALRAVATSTPLVQYDIDVKARLSFTCKFTQACVAQ